MARSYVGEHRSDEVAVRSKSHRAQHDWETVGSLRWSDDGCLIAMAMRDVIEDAKADRSDVGAGEGCGF
jgi:hypothetical protein